MARPITRNALLLSACVGALTLSGCGGGGGGGPSPAAPAPPPAASPPPPPAPTAINYNDSEYNRSNGANSAKALGAYQAGATGKGVKIAIVDSGINAALPEFAGRIDPASRDIASKRGVVDNEGHGTAVAGVAAAARNGRDIMGVAFDSTILSLNTADPTDCDDDGCKHSSADIAEAIDVARTNGARVINISLGGGGAGQSLLDAISTATRAGIVIVISAGNDGTANPDDFALTIAQQAGNGRVIIAGATDASRQLASFSNKAGTGAQYYLSALGDRVRTFDQNGTSYLYSGTSFSAPVISGAAALLASAFPNLSASEIVQLLLSTADDAGAAGRDTTFGNGILNITRAFAPQGATTLAGTQTAISLTNNGQASGPMGDASAQAAGAVILDGYKRAYTLDLAKTVERAPAERPLAQSLLADTRSRATFAGTTAVSITVNRNLVGQPEVGLAQLGMTYEDSRRAKVVAGLALSRLSPKTAVALGLSESGKTLQLRLAGQAQNAFLVARDPMSRTGFYGNNSRSIGFRHDLGPAALTLTSERGRVYTPDLRRSIDEPRYAIDSLALDRRVGPASFSLGASRLEERETLLGGRFSSNFVRDGATSYFLDAGATLDFGRGWGAYASYRRGWTDLAGGALAEGGRLSTDAFSLDMSKRSAFARGDMLAFRIMQPLRVRSGGFAMNLPVSYDYATLQAGFENRHFSLAPSGREIDFEAAYGIDLLGGSLSANTFLRRQPGHIAAADDDIGGALRFTLGL